MVKHVARGYNNAIRIISSIVVTIQHDFGTTTSLIMIYINICVLFYLLEHTWGCVMVRLPFVPPNVVVFRQRHKRDCLENAAASCPNRYDDGADSFSSVERRTRCVYSDYRLPYHTGTHWIPPPSVHRPPKASFVLSQQSPPPSAVCLVALYRERVAVPRWN